MKHPNWDSAGNGAKNNAQFGPPIKNTASDYTNDGLFSDVRITWLTSHGEEYSVGISSYQGKVWASISSSAQKSLCK